MSLADLETALEIGRISPRLYPNDIDFALIQAMSLAASGEMERGSKMIESTDLGDEKKADWLNPVKFCWAVYKISLAAESSTNHRRFVAATSADVGARFETLLRIVQSRIQQMNVRIAPILNGQRHPDLLRR